GAGRRAADGVRIGADQDAVFRIGQRSRPADVRADPIALDHVASGERGGSVKVHGVGQIDAVASVAGDKIAGTRCRTADRVVGGGDHEDAAEGVTFGECASDVGADVVALYEHAGPDQDAAVAAAVAGDDVAGAGGRTADRVACAATKLNPLEEVAENGGAGGIEADDVPGDQVIDGAEPC